MRRIGWWLVAGALTLVLGGGCAGVISEKSYEDGRLERIRLDSGTKWSVYDRNPTKQDDTAIFLKKESTF